MASTKIIVHLSADYDKETGAVIQASMKDHVESTDFPGEEMERWISKREDELPAEVLNAFVALRTAINTFLGRA